MSTDKQIAANRRNAHKSTGPRTPEGKARSAQSARKHGFTASTFAVVRLEELDEVAHLKADLVACYQPVNSQELLALERMAVAQQTMLRAARLEVGLCTSCLNESLFSDGQSFTPLSTALTGDIEVTRAQNRNFALAYGFRIMAEAGNTWALCLRYTNEAERHYRRALEEFDRLKALRGELPNHPNFDPQLEPSPATSIPVPANAPVDVPPDVPASKDTPPGPEAEAPVQAPRSPSKGPVGRSNWDRRKRGEAVVFGCGYREKLASFRQIRFARPGHPLGGY